MKAIRFQYMPQRSLWTLVILGLFLLFCVVALTPGVAYADNPAPVQIFYVSLPEADALTVLDAIHSAADPPMYTYFSIAVGFDNAYVYYDQWEDGYAADIANPTAAELYNSATNPAGVQIWGNGLAADGCAPNIDGVAFACTNAADVLYAGNVIIPYNQVAVPRVAVAQSYVLDTFATASYSRNDGNTNWSTNWVETGDNGLPGSGDINITNGVLRFFQTEPNDSIYRGVSLPTGDACATLSLALGQDGVDSTGDYFAVQVSSDGVNYTTLETYDSPTDAGAKSYSISSYASANTRVRFISINQLEANEYWSIDNVRVEWNCSYPILYDARDKVGASKFISMARAVWATGSGTLNAYAHEMYSTEEWGTTYESPVGTNTAYPGTSMFQYSALTIMASQDNTQVQIDANADGTYETTVPLQEGGSRLVTGILQGARVVADKPVQVALLTGDIGDTYESRDMSLLPVSIWGSSYWSPVGVMQAEYGAPGNPTRLYLYNLSTNGNIYITCERYGVPNTRLGPVAPRGVVTIDLGANQGARCYASDSGGTATTDLIFGIGTIDTAAGDGGGADGSRSDWSVTLFPDDFLTTDALVGLGLGKDPTDTTSTENGSPLWVTAACSSGSTYVYVDWNSDGTADQVDTNGDDVGEAGSQNGILVNRLQSVRLFEPGADEEEFDQSGARIWSRTASGVGYGGTAGCRLAVAWGQDPPNATAGAPGLDVGTSVPPMRLTEGTKSLALKTDADGDGLLSPGDTATYNMTVHNSMLATVANVYIYDLVPANTTYVAGSTQKDVGSGWIYIPDDGSGTPFPLDVTGGVLLGNLPSGATFYVRFDVTLNAVANYDELLNCDTAFAAGTFTRCAATFVASYDWGDLPDTYGTARAADGPRHSPSGLMLGSAFDHELQGQPTTGAVGDDTAHSPDDEDGVTLAGTTAEWWEGSGKFSVTVTGGPGCLNAWMDFTNDTGSGAGTTYADGNFTKTGGYDAYSTYSEYIIQNILVSTGTSIVQVTVPPALNAQTTNPYYFRFRLSPPVAGLCTTAIAPSGLVAGGEVEDYQFELKNVATAVQLLSLEATGREEFIEVSWETASETDNLGFNLYRATSAAGSRTRINAELIPTQVPPGSPFGAVYSYEDTTVVRGQVYYYWLEVVDIYGQSELYGPVEAQVEENQSDLPDIPPALELLLFEATGGEEYVELSWETASETDNLGFNLYRATALDGERSQVNEELIPTQVPPGSPFGAVYQYADTTVVPKETYYYWLEVVDIYGQSELYGPVEAQVEDEQSDLPDTSPAVELLWFEATGREECIELSWETASETDNLGFNLFRAASLDEERDQVNEELIPTQVPPGSPFGAAYEYEDTVAGDCQTCYYWLEVVDIYGQSELHGPVEAQVEDNQSDLPDTSPAVELLLLEITGREEFIELRWETASEIDNLGFNLYRATSLDGERTKINAELIPTVVPPVSPFGAVYEYEDTTVILDGTYYYWLEVVDIYGQSELHGPVSAKRAS